MNKEVPNWQTAPEFLKDFVFNIQKAMEYKLQSPANYVGAMTCYENMFNNFGAIFEEQTPDLFALLGFSLKKINEYQQKFTECKMSTIRNPKSFMDMVKYESLMIKEINEFHRILMKAAYHSRILIPKTQLEIDIKGEEVLGKRY